MFVAVIYYDQHWNSKGKTPHWVQHGTHISESKEEAAAKALTTINQLRVSYPSTPYRVELGELTHKVEQPRPPVEITPLF